MGRRIEGECLKFISMQEAGLTKLQQCPFNSFCDGKECPLDKQFSNINSPEDKEQESAIFDWEHRN